MKSLNVNRSRIATIILAVLLISSTFAIFTANSLISTNALSLNLNPETGQAYGDLSQYEWQALGADGANTRSSDGPAPNTPTLSWSQTASSVGTLTAFNGYVFVLGSSSVSAYAADTGTKAWETAINGAVAGSVGAVVKISNSTCAYLATNGVVWYTISSGAASPAKSTISTTLTGSAVYDPDTNLFIATAANGVGVCIDVSTAGTATVAWTFNSGASSLTALAIGNGMAFFTSGSKVYAVNIKDAHGGFDGSKAWEAAKTGSAVSATYADSVLYVSASSSQITAFDAATGTVLNTFNSTATFADGSAAKYGRIFSAALSTQSWVGCWDDNSLVQQWKQPATYNSSYVLGAAGDRKFYVCTDNVSPGYSLSAFDAFTGQQVWTKTTTTTVTSLIVAYGNLYIMDGSKLQCYSDDVSQTQATSGWYMYHGYDDINGLTQTGVATGSYPSKIATADWKYKADAPISGSPVAVNGLIYFGTFNGSLYCVDSDLGTLVWRNNYNVNGSALSVRILSTPTVINGVLYTGADDGNVYALNANNGSQIWKAAAGGISEMPLQKGTWQVKSSPCYYNGRIIVGSMDGNCYCFNSTTGAQIWATSVSTTAVGIGSTPIVYQGRDNVIAAYIYANAAIKKLNIDTGAQINSTSVTSSAGTDNTGSITIYKDYMFVTSGNTATSKLLVYNATTLGSLNSITFSSVSASTPMTETPTLVENQTCFIPSGTNLGYTGAQYKVNQTSAGNWTRILTVLYQGEATSADCVAMIKPGDDLGAAMGTSPGATGLDQHWIVNATAPYFIKLWSAWVGHELFASESVALDVNNPTWSPLVYIGNAVYGFTCYNGSSGEVLSTYTAQGAVFATAALYNNKVYITAEDDYLVCLSGSTTSQVYLSASSNVNTVDVNQPITISGQLITSQTYTANNSTEVFGPYVPYTEISLVWTKPDFSSEVLNVMTDAHGNFSFTYTPTTSGSWTWLTYSAESRTAYSTLAQGYTSPSTITVNAPSTTPTPTPSSTPTTTPPVISAEIIYAIAGVVVALIVIIAVVMLLRKRKK